MKPERPWAHTIVWIAFIIVLIYLVKALQNTVFIGIINVIQIALKNEQPRRTDGRMPIGGISRKMERLIYLFSVNFNHLRVLLLIVYQCTQHKKRTLRSTAEFSA